MFDGSEYVQKLVKLGRDGVIDGGTEGIEKGLRCGREYLGLLGVLVVFVEAVELRGDAKVRQQLATVPRVLRQDAI